MVKLRLRRLGRKKRPFFQIVALDHRSRRDGRFLAKLGFYDPINDETRLDVKGIREFLKTGAQPSKTVLSLLTKSRIIN
mgnify:CR=1 FL=1